MQVALGQVLHQLDELLPANSLPLDDIFAAALLIFFGAKTLLVRASPVLLSHNIKTILHNYLRTALSFGRISLAGNLQWYG